MSINIRGVGTETFYNNYIFSKLSDMVTYAEDVWESEIEDGSGSYEAYFSSYGSSEVEVSSWWLCNDDGTSCSDLWERADDADAYLQDYFDYYSSSDVIIVADYMEDPNDNYHWGVAQQVAGTSTDKVCLIDVAQIEGTTGPWDNEESEGVTAHEVLHMFIDENDSEHYPHINSLAQASLMWDSGGIDITCNYSNRSANAVSKYCSSCTVNYVRNYIDNHSI